MEGIIGLIAALCTHLVAAFSGWAYGYREGFGHACKLHGTTEWVVKNCRRGWRPAGRPGLTEHQDVHP